MQYKVLMFADKLINQAIENLEKEVAKYIGTGWTPQGGINIAIHPSGYYFVSQAVIRK